MRPEKIRRRDMAKVTIGSATVFPAWRLVESAKAQESAGGRTSEAGARETWTPKFLSAKQNELVTTIAEMIIPETDTPGARAAKVNEHIDLVLSEETAEAQKGFLDGLAWVGQESLRRFEREFLELPQKQQVELLTLISDGNSVPSESESGRRFFRDIRRRTVFAYYTSRIGIHDELEYKGKRPLAEWVGCPHPEHHDDAG